MAKERLLSTCSRGALPLARLDSRCHDGVDRRERLPSRNDHGRAVLVRFRLDDAEKKVLNGLWHSVDQVAATAGRATVKLALIAAEVAVAAALRVALSRTENAILSALPPRFSRMATRACSHVRRG